MIKKQLHHNRVHWRKLHATQKPIDCAYGTTYARMIDTNAER